MLRHDCVTIPQLGAFVTQWIDATWAQDEPLFLPPRRSVRFNTDIRTDDGLLVDSIQRTYHISQAEAKRKVQTLVLSLRQQLLTDGWADFGTLGQFTQDEDGILNFEPCPAGAVTPSFYGLETLFFPRLDKVQKAKALRNNAQSEERPRLLSISTNHGDIDIHIGHRLVRNVGVAAALAVLFFLLPIHIGKPNHLTPSEATISPISHQNVEAQASPKATPSPETIATPAVSESTESPVVSDAPETPEASAVTESQVPSTRFAVVLASAIPQQRAERYAEELTAKGLTNVQVLKQGKMVRVVMDGFLTEGRAYQELNDLRERSSEFESAWVLKIDN